MKQFFKYVFASFVGTLLFSIIMGCFAFITIIGMIASTQTTNEIKDNSVLVLNLSGQLTERSEDNNIISQLQGKIGTIGLDNLLSAIDKAKNSRQPSVIIAHTIPGRGVDFMEYDYRWHGKSPNAEEAERALAQLSEGSGE